MATARVPNSIRNFLGKLPGQRNAIRALSCHNISQENWGMEKGEILERSCIYGTFSVQGYSGCSFGKCVYEIILRHSNNSVW